MTPEHTANPSLAEGASLSRNYSSGPGRIIRLARETARLGIDQLAQQTKLTRTTLDALERDDFGVLNEAVYVRGYYRKIAKALALSEKELIAAYEGLVVPKAPPAPTKLLLGSGDNGATRSRRRNSGVWIVVALAVVILFVIAAKLASHGSNSTVSATAPESILAPAEQATSSPSTAVPVSELSSQSTRSDSSSDAVNGAGDRPVQQPVAVQPQTATGDAATLAAVDANASPDALVLSFKSTSWVRIEDGSGKLMLSGIIQSGDRQVISGKPPYAVFLGNAPGVVLEFQGKSVNIRPYIKDNNSARFSVP